MTQRILVAVAAALILVQFPVFGKPKRKEYNNPAAQVFDAALRTARERHVVTYVDDKHLMFTFETGQSFFADGFLANASVEPVTETKSALLINVQHKPGDSGGFSFNAGDRMADKFYQQVAEDLARKSTQETAVKPEEPPVTVPPAPVAGTATPDYGTVGVVCSSESADVTVDGAFVGNSPAALRLAPGKHTVRVSLAGYKPWSREITVMAGAELKLVAALEKE